MPIFMFDKDGAFAVMRLEQVSSAGKLELERIYGLTERSSCHYPLAPKLLLLWPELDNDKDDS
jgi:hypothetical protein